MRIVLVNKFHYIKGGSETYYFGLAESLRELGHEVAFFSMEDDRNEDSEQSRYFVPNRDYNNQKSLIKNISAAATLTYSPVAKRRFQELCEEFKPDVIHMNLVHHQITLSILDAPYLKDHKVPVIWTSHDYSAVCPAYTMLDGNGSVCDACLEEGFGACVRRKCIKHSRAKSALGAFEAYFLNIRKYYNKIDMIIAPSAFMRSKLIEGGFPSAKVITMINFIKCRSESEMASRTGDSRSAYPYLLFFGRLSHEKGVDILVESFSSIAREFPDWRLVVVGDGPERPHIEAMLSDGTAREKIELAGFQRGDELRNSVSNAAFTVMSSCWRENMPYSILESFSMGTPVVGTRIGGIPEIVIEGETGFVCEPGSVSSLADGLRRAMAFYGDNDSYQKMQARCLDFVSKEGDQGEYVKRLVALYRKLIDQKKAGCDSR